jgi:hypothetical protein
MLTFSSATAEVEMMSAKTGRLWGTLVVGLSWEGRDAIAAKVIAANGLSVDISQSKVLGQTFAYNYYTKVSRKIGLV